MDKTTVKRPDIEAISRRLDGVPGPVWIFYSEEGELVLPSGERTKTQTASVCIGDYSDQNHKCILTTMGKDEEEAVRVAHFAACARQDIPDMIDYIRYLESIVGKI